MMQIDAEKVLYTSKISQPLSAVSTVAFVYSSEFPVAVDLVNPDGEIVRCGTLPPAIMDWHKMELRNFIAIGMSVVPPDVDGEDETSDVGFLVQLDVRHKTGERISSEKAVVPVSDHRHVNEQERVRRIVMATINNLQVTPSEDQLDALETELGFDFFGEDGLGEFGTEVLAEEPQDTPEPKPAPNRRKVKEADPSLGQTPPPDDPPEEPGDD